MLSIIEDGLEMKLLVVFSVFRSHAYFCTSTKGRLDLAVSLFQNGLILPNVVRIPTLQIRTLVWIVSVSTFAKNIRTVESPYIADNHKAKPPSPSISMPRGVYFLQIYLSRFFVFKIFADI